ncbi:hypothetical protein HAX54_025442, partial [Datura stramonium]|nr:hypothetical protein [Datura stramonium]
MTDSYLRRVSGRAILLSGSCPRGASGRAYEWERVPDNVQTTLLFYERAGVTSAAVRPLQRMAQSSEQ